MNGIQTDEEQVKQVISIDSGSETDTSVSISIKDKDLSSNFKTTISNAVQYKLEAIKKALKAGDNETFNKELAHSTNHLLSKVAPLIDASIAAPFLNTIFLALEGHCRSIEVHLRWASLVFQYQKASVMKDSHLLEKVYKFLDNNSSRVTTLIQLNKLSSRIELIRSQRQLLRNHFKKQQFERLLKRKNNNNEQEQEQETSDIISSEHDSDGSFEQIELEGDLGWNEQDLLEELSEYEELSDTPEIVKRRRTKKGDSDRLESDSE